MLKTLITYDTLHSNKEVQPHNFLTTKWEGTFLAGWDPNAILGYLCQIKLALVITLRPGEQGYQNAGFHSSHYQCEQNFITTSEILLCDSSTFSLQVRL